MAAPEFLAAQQHLNLTIGALNTVVLLTSSWFVARSVVKARAGEDPAALTFIEARLTDAVHDAARRLRPVRGAAGLPVVGAQA